VKRLALAAVALLAGCPSDPSNPDTLWLALDGSELKVKLIDHVKLPTHDLFVGEVVGTYADVNVLTNGIVDIAKLKPLLFDMASKKYWSLGEPVAKCWSVGKEYSPNG